jgi:hypothetical protein
MVVLPNGLFQEEYARDWVLENRDALPVRGPECEAIKAEMAQLEVRH